MLEALCGDADVPVVVRGQRIRPGGVVLSPSDPVGDGVPSAIWARLTWVELWQRPVFAPPITHHGIAHVRHHQSSPRTTSPHTAQGSQLVCVEAPKRSSWPHNRL